MKSFKTVLALANIATDLILTDTMKTRITVALLDINLTVCAHDTRDTYTFITENN